MPRSPLRAAIISAVAPSRVGDVDRRTEREQLPDQGIVTVGGGLHQPGAEALGLREQRGGGGMAARNGELMRADTALDGGDVDATRRAARERPR